MGQAAGSGEPDARPGVDVVFFDIDDTLYRPEQMHGPPEHLAEEIQS